MDTARLWEKATHRPAEFSRLYCRKSKGYSSVHIGYTGSMAPSGIAGSVALALSWQPQLHVKPSASHLRDVFPRSAPRHSCGALHATPATHHARWGSCQKSERPLAMLQAPGGKACLVQDKLCRDKLPEDVAPSSITLQATVPAQLLHESTPAHEPNRAIACSILAVKSMGSRVSVPSSVRLNSF